MNTSFRVTRCVAFSEKWHRIDFWTAPFWFDIACILLTSTHKRNCECPIIIFLEWYLNPLQLEFSGTSIENTIGGEDLKSKQTLFQRFVQLCPFLNGVLSFLQRHLTESAFRRNLARTSQHPIVRIELHICMGCVIIPGDSPVRFLPTVNYFHRRGIVEMRLHSCT